MMNGFERYTKKTRRALFLEEMERVVPWGKLCGLIEPYYPKAGNGRQPVGVELDLRERGCNGNFGYSCHPATKLLNRSLPRVTT